MRRPPAPHAAPHTAPHPAGAPARRLRPVVLAAALAAGLAPGAGWALPEGATPVQGQVALRAGAPGTLELVQATPRAALDWRSFSIAAGEQVLVRQPDAASVLFNRVTGSDPSLILGRLQANGRVFLSNPRGVVFGAGSQVDVGSLVATTLAVNTAALADGRWQLAPADGGSGALRADGEIRASGTVALVAPSVSVGGRIDAPRIGLAAAGAVQVDVDGDGLVFFNLRDAGLDARLRLLPAATLRAGSAELRAAARSGFADTVLNLEGAVRATGFALRDGQVVIDGGAAGVTRVAGTVDASAAGPGLRGGQVSVLGGQVWLDAGARLLAQGDAGGGTLLVGGNWQGGGDERRARLTLVADDVLLDASALRLGAGGRIVVWSDGATVFNGQARARGGAEGGDGGAVETSGLRQLGIAYGRVDTGAPGGGRTGRWLLDPKNLSIAATGTAGVTLADLDTFAERAGDDLAIANSVINAAGSDVVLQAKEDITVSAAVAMTAAGKGLTLQAGRSITVSAPIGTHDGAIALLANDSGGSANGSGRVVLGATLSAGSGAVTVSNQGGGGVHALNADIGAGTLSVVGDAVLGAGVRTLTLGAGESTVAGLLSGSGGLKKAGAGTLTLTGAHSYSGGTELAAGTLRLSGGGQPGAAAAGLLLNGGTLDLRDGATLGHALQVNGGRLANGSGSARLDGALTLAADLAVDAAGTLTLAGVVDGSGGLAKLGEGTLRLLAANPYAGPTTVAAGTLALVGGGRAGDATAELQLQGGTLDLRDGAVLANPLRVSGGRLATGSGTGQLDGTITLEADLAVRVDGDSLTLAGPIADGAAPAAARGLSLSGSGVLTLAAANAYRGPTTVSGATLALAADDRLGPAALAQTLTLAGGATLRATADFTLDAARPLRLDAGGGRFEVGAGLTLDLAGVASGPGGLAKRGDGTLRLSAANTYSGGTTLDAGTLAIGSAGRAGDAATELLLQAGTLDLRDGAVLANPLRVRGGTLANSVGGGRLDGTVALEADLAVRVDGDGLTLAGAITDGAAPATARGLTLTGSGVLTLGAANAYRGPTTVEGATLAVAADDRLGPAGADNPLTLADGGTLQALAGFTLDAARRVLLGVAGGAIDVAAGATLTAGRGFTGVGGLVKRGDGRLALAAGNAFDGPTALQAGTLALADGSLASGAALTVQGGVLDLGGAIQTVASLRLEGGQVGNGTLVATAGSTVLAGRIDAVLDGGTLTKTGTGTATLGAANLHHGTALQDGRLVVASDAALGDAGDALAFSGGTLQAAAALQLGRAVTVAGSGSRIDTQGRDLQLAGTLAGNGALELLGGGSLTLAGDGAGFNGSLGVQAGTLRLAHAGALRAAALSLADSADAVLGLQADSAVGRLSDGAHSVVDLGGHRLDLGGAGGDSALVGTLRGSTAATLLKSGAGVLTLSGNAGGFAGQAQLAGGTLALNLAAGLPGATVTLADAPGVALRLLADTALGGLAGAGAAQATVDLVGHTLRVGGNGQATRFDGQVVSTGGGGSLVKTGTGTLALGRANGHAGGTRVEGGTLAIAADDRLGAAGAALTLDGGTLQLDGRDLTLAASRTLQLDGAGGTLDTQGHQLTLAATLAGTGTLRKAGSGTLLLAGAAGGFSGATTVAAGTLALDGDARLGAPGSLLTLDGGGLRALATLALDAARPLAIGAAGGTLDSGGFGLTLGGPLSGTGTLRKAGGGMLTLAAASPGFRGASVVDAGQLRLDDADALSASALTVAAGATLRLDTDAALAGLAGAGEVRLGSFRLAVGSNGADSRFDGRFSGAGGRLVKRGAGTLTLAGASSHDGGTRVAEGTLVIDADDRLGDPSGTLTLAAGATLRAGADLALAASRSVELAGGEAAIDTAGHAVAVAGVIDGAGALVKQGAGTLSLGGQAKFYAGGTRIEAGTLRLDVLAPGSGTVTLAGGELALAQSVLLNNPLLLAGGRVDNLSGQGWLAGPLTLAADATLAVSGGSLLLTGGIVETGGPRALSKTGAGELTLAAANGHSGGTRVLDGTLVLFEAAALGATSGALTLDGGTLLAAASLALEPGRALLLGAGGGRIDTGGNELWLLGPLSGAGALAKLGAGRLWLAGDGSGFSGATTVAAGTLALDDGQRLGGGALTLQGGATLQALADLDLGAGRTLTLGAGGGTVDTAHHAVTLQGGLAGGGTLVKLGPGGLTLSSAAAGFSGAVDVRDGTLALAAEDRLGSAGLLGLSGGATLQALADFAWAPGRTLQLDGSGGRIDSNGHTVVLQGTLAGGGELVKLGAGTLVLAGDAPGFTGATRVSAGTLAIRADAQLGAATSTLSLEHGGTLRADADLELAAGRDLWLAGSGGRIDTNGHDLRLTGTLAGGGTLTKLGEGTLWLTGPGNGLTFGHLTVAGGTVAADSDLRLGAGTLTLEGGGTLRALSSFMLWPGRTLVLGAGGGVVEVGAGLQLDAPVPQAEAVPGAGTLTKRGAGRLWLLGASGRSGLTTLAEGELVLGSGALSPAGALAVQDGTLNLAGGMHTVTTLAMTGGQIVNGGLVATQGHTLSAGTVDASLGGGPLTKTGPGTATLHGANFHVGGTAVLGGTLAVAGDAALGAAGEPLHLDGGTLRALGALDLGTRTVVLGAAGGTLDSAGQALSLAGVLAGNGPLTKAGAGTLSLRADAQGFTGATVVGGGVLALDADARLGAAASALTLDGGTLQALADLSLARPLQLGAGGGTLDSQGHALALSGTLTGSAALTKTGPGTLTLAADASAFSGATTVAGGTLALDRGDRLGAAASALTLDGGTLRALADLDLGSRPLVLAAGGGSIDSGGHDLALTGALAGSGALRKTGAGTLLLGGDGSGFSGSSTVAEGTLALARDGALGGGVLGVAGGRLDLRGASLANALLLDGGVLASSGAAATLSGAVALLAPTTVEVGSGGLTLAGALSGSGGLDKAGDGLLTLAAANGHAGGTRVRAGTLAIAADDRLGSGALTLDGGALRALGDLTLGAGRALVLDAGGGTLDTAGHTLRVDGPLAGSGALAKAGSGTLALAGAGGFGGDLRVQAGTLQLHPGALAASGTVQLDDAAGVVLALAGDAAVGALAGGGAAGGRVQLHGHTLTLGASGADARFAGRIDGDAGAGLVKQGGGRWTLDAATGFAGTLDLQQGSVALAQGQALADAALRLDAGAALLLQADATLRGLGDGGAGGGSVALDRFRLTLGGDGASSRFSGSLAGSGGLTKVGAGRLTLAGANGYTGSTEVQAGQLRLEGGQALAASAAVQLADAAGVQLELAGDQTLGALDGGGARGGDVQLGTQTLTLQADAADSAFAGALRGAGRLVKAGAGTLALSGASQHGGGTLVAGGTLRVDRADALPTGGDVALADAAGAVLELRADQTLGRLSGGGTSGGELRLAGSTLRTGAGGDSRFDGRLAGSGALVKQGAGSFTLAGSQAFAGTVRVDAGALVLAGVQALGDGAALTLADAAGVQLRLEADATLGALAGGGAAGGEVLLGVHTLRTGALGGDQRFDGVLSGDGGLVKQGAGTLTLGGRNRHTGPTEVRAGVLSVADDAALGAVPASATPGRLLLDGGTLAFSASTTVAATRGIALVGDAGGIDVAGGQTVTLAGTLADGAAAGALVKRGAGTLVLAGAADSSHSGATQVLGGTLVLARDGQLGAAPAVASPQQLLLDGGTLRVAADATLAATRGLWLGAGGGTLAVDAGATLALPGPVGGVAAVPGSLAGTLRKTGGGVLRLDGTADNAYGGATQVLGGTLALSRDGQLGAAPATRVADQLLLDGGTLQWLGDGALDAHRGLALGAGGGTLAVADGRTLTLQAALADAGGGAGRLAKTGDGLLRLAGPASARRGGTDVLGGTLALTDDAQLGAPPATATADQLVLDGGTLRAEADARLAATRGLQLGAGGGTLAVADGATLQVAGRIGDGAVPGMLTKTGAGTLSLDSAGANPYRGATRVLGGTLAIDRDAQLGSAPADATPGQLLLDGGTLRVRADTTLAATRGLALGAGGGTLAVDAGRTLAYDGRVADEGAGGAGSAGPLDKAGAGTLVLGGDNAHSGGTRVLAGTLATRGDERLPDAGALWLADGATLRLGGNESVGLFGDLPGAPAVGSARVELGAFMLTVEVPGGTPDLLFSGTLDSAGGGRLFKRGDGVLQLRGTAQGDGLVEVVQGTLVGIGARSLSPDATVRVAANATLRLDEAVTVRTLDLSGVLDGVGRMTATADALLAGGLLAAPLSTPRFVSRGDGRVAAALHADDAVVQTGTLTLAGGGSLAATRLQVQAGAALRTVQAAQLAGGAAALQVDAGGLLWLAGAEAASSLALAGRLAGDGALALTGTAALQGGELALPLRTPGLDSRGASRIAAAVQAERLTLRDGGLTLAAGATLDTPLLQLQAGELRTEGAQALAAGTALTVAAGATLTLGGDERVQSLALSGRLRQDAPVGVAALRAALATPTLAVSDTTLLDGATVQAPLATAQLLSQGSSRLDAPVLASTSATLRAGTLAIGAAGQLDAPLLLLQAGTLRTEAAQRVAGSAQLQMAAGSTLQLGGDQTLAALADAGGAAPGTPAAQVLLGAHSLAVGAGGGDAVFSGRLSGEGTLVKQGTGRWTLRADQDHGDTVVEAGTLQLGDGGSAGSLGRGAVHNAGTLRVDRADTLRLDRPLGGSGVLEQAGNGTLLLATGALAHSGDTVVRAGTLRTEGAGALSAASHLRVAAGGRLVLAGDETVSALDADGPVALGGALRSAGDQRYGGPVEVVAAAPVTLAAPDATIEALHDDNRWGTRPLSLQAGQVRLSAGRTATVDGGTYRDLVLGQVLLSGRVGGEAGAGASRIEAGRLQLGATGAAGGTASGLPALDGLLQLDGGSLALLAHARPAYTLAPVATGELQPLDPLRSRPLWLAEDVIAQGAHSQVLTATGSALLLHADAGGSIALDQVRNRLAGGVAALSGAAWATPWSAVELEGGRAAGQGVVALAGQQLLVGGAGLEADVLRIRAGQLATAPGSVLAARLWYNDAGAGVERSLPGLALTLLPEALAADRAFGRADAPIAVSIGARSLGERREGLSAGFVRVLPRQAAGGTRAVFLAGPRSGADGYLFFHDGAGDPTELPVFYNGVLPATPQLSSSLSAVASVSETARRERFEEAVRTENVAIRLRAGVIAEVGPGRPATQGAQGLRLPATCALDLGRLGCTP